ncbi:MAG TPA: DUF3617 family protein [Burkholderiaceae bacterium]|nr:DUF3617 family protein [Burkholderiaceae bacterium]
MRIRRPTPPRVRPAALAPALALALLAVAPAAAQDVPVRRPGLWEITMQTTGAPSQLVRHCVDARTDREMQRFGRSHDRAACSRDTWLRDGERWVGEAECRVGSSVARTTSVFAGDFERAYKGEVDTVFRPPLASISRSKVTIAGRWAGPCPKGWTPGDMELPGMGRINVDERLAGRPVPAPAR